MVDSTRGSGVQVYAQTMHDASEGAFTGEISARMLTELDVHGAILGHSERRQLFGETDRALAGEGPGGARRRDRAAAVRRRDRGGARRGRDRSQAAPSGAGGAREGRERAAGRCRDRLRADLGDRDRQERDARAGAGGDRRSSGRWSPTATASRRSARGSSTAARSSPRTPRSCWRCPTSTARSSAARRWIPESFAAIVGPRSGVSRSPVRLPGGARRLGDGPARARATRWSWRTRRCSTSSGRATRTRS